MSKPIIRIHDIETNEIIDREMTDKEFKEFQKNQLVELELQKEIELKKSQKKAILDRLGLTDDELNTILG